MIFTVLEMDDTIRRRIWPQKRDAVSRKLMATYDKKLTQKILASEPEFYPVMTKNDR